MPTNTRKGSQRQKLHTTPTLDLFLNKNTPDFRHESVFELADCLTPLPNCRNSTVTCQRVLPEADRYDMTKEPKAKKEAETRSTGNAALFSSFLPVFSLVSPESSVVNGTVQPLSPKLSSGLATTAVKTQSPRGCRRAYLRRRSCGPGQPASHGTGLFIARRTCIVSARPTVYPTTEFSYVPLARGLINHSAWPTCMAVG